MSTETDYNDAPFVSRYDEAISHARTKPEADTIVPILRAAKERAMEESTPENYLGQFIDYHDNPTDLNRAKNLRLQRPAIQTLGGITGGAIGLGLGSLAKHAPMLSKGPIPGIAKVVGLAAGGIGGALGMKNVTQRVIGNSLNSFAETHNRLSSGIENSLNDSNRQLGSYKWKDDNGRIRSVAVTREKDIQKTASLFDPKPSPVALTDSDFISKMRQKIRMARFTGNNFYRTSNGDIGIIYQSPEQRRLATRGREKSIEVVEDNPGSIAAARERQSLGNEIAEEKADTSTAIGMIGGGALMGLGGLLAGQILKGRVSRHTPIREVLSSVGMGVGGLAGGLIGHNYGQKKYVAPTESYYRSLISKMKREQ